MGVGCALLPENDGWGEWRYRRGLGGGGGLRIEGNVYAWFDGVSCGGGKGKLGSGRGSRGARKISNGGEWVTL
jgi:hypothetical protein